MAQTDSVQLARQFEFVKILNENPLNKSLNLLGKIDGQDAIIIAEKSAFDATPEALAVFTAPTTLEKIKENGQNDIYHWFLANFHHENNGESRHDLKFTLIHPATAKHIAKYSKQTLRMVTETAEIYRDHVKSYIDAQRGDGRINWVYNILDKKKEADRIIYEDEDKETGFILAPDLKWDRVTMGSLYCLAVVHRRDIASIRDLRKKDVGWLKEMKKKMLAGTCAAYPGMEEDKLRIYIHYQPSYYHFHVHVVALDFEGGLGQSAGKAILLDDAIARLEEMAGDENAGFEKSSFTYFLGEESELWQNVFAKIKAGNNE
ncbi:scavenger mRNA decapping enzyme [Ascobolus immersus RN42]|uniref:Scavenger mRNA decapping enzyme n=1 Tax=Ascobolus immersus RN42 TaxID=1160509 RepID=A0A3N4IEL3_ASCIM|nr:scavenger mRNA decapping enzyme [Ascobolus immersus RN42]